MELSKAFELADEFEKDFSKDNQIYLTTHSPAFYDLSGPNISKWLVKSTNFNPDTPEFHTHVADVHAGQDADETLGIAALISSRAKELFLQIGSLNNAQKELEKKLANVAKAQVIVEGPTDKKILEVAFSKLFPNEELFCEFISAEGADNLTHNLKSFKTLDKTYPFPIIGLYDNDQKGRGEYRNFNKYKLVENDQFRELSLEKRLFCGLLPIQDELKAASTHYKEKSGYPFEVPLSIEFMFPHSVIKDAVQKKKLVLKESEMVAKHSSGIQLPLNMSQECKKYLPEDYDYLAYEIDDASKGVFSTWIAELDSAAFHGFNSIFSTLKSLSNP